MKRIRTEWQKSMFHDLSDKKKERVFIDENYFPAVTVSIRCIWLSNCRRARLSSSSSCWRLLNPRRSSLIRSNIARRSLNKDNFKSIHILQGIPYISLLVIWGDNGMFEWSEEIVCCPIGNDDGCSSWLVLLIPIDRKIMSEWLSG